MNWLDLIIGLFLLAALIRGRELGLVRQVLSSVGCIGGLLVGAWAQAKFGTHAATAQSRALLSLLVTLGFAMAFLSIGEYVGALAKFRLQAMQRLNKIDRAFGSVVGGATLLIGVWLGASLFTNVPSVALQRQIHGSAIVAQLNKSLPAAPNVIARISHLIEPNGFPEVFTGLEPAPPKPVSLPDLGELNSAVRDTQASVVKIEGRGCGGIVEGSGFVARDGLVATNAHVVAGVIEPYVQDGNGTHRASVMLFDPDLDLAILRTTNLKGQPLGIATQTVATGTPAVILGYPGGGNFNAGPAAIMDSFVAVGRNIYNQGETSRSVYSVKGTVVPGNSGGPLVDKEGRVIGLIFAQSTAYDQVGYALTMQRVSQGIAQASSVSHAVSTGDCAE
ncbi:MAG TPA: MarP family serine protease [Nevskiaceae bacterium]|nr:MarP family serine protease [Nevskiaceae bacterium]